MNSQSIADIASKLFPLTKLFRGVFSSNNIEKFSSFPYCLIANTDRMGSMGSHWVAIFVNDRNNVEYFDSYGEPPNEDLKSHLSKFARIKHGNVKLQSFFSDTCGYYALFFLFMRSIGIEYDSIIKILRNRSDRDIYVKNFITQNIR